MNIRKLISVVILSSAGLFGIVQLSSAASHEESCDNDVKEMKQQIENYDLVTARHGCKVNKLIGTANQNKDMCTNTCANHWNQYNCQWVLGNWGKTLACN
ncbi:MAG: hypothetical protein CMF50_07190 [Legionellales bacterium]|nr:hypothetical protein [Legionellales bacterium]|tara:strand:+ start:23235 stop:23534 length:300 start_codon:yes stop_codon:yes gene_type:complete